MGLITYSCGHISSPHEPIPTKFGLWELSSCSTDIWYSNYWNLKKFFVTSLLRYSITQCHCGYCKSWGAAVPRLLQQELLSYAVAAEYPQHTLKVHSYYTAIALQCRYIEFISAASHCSITTNHVERNLISCDTPQCCVIAWVCSAATQLRCSMNGPLQQLPTCSIHNNTAQHETYISNQGYLNVKY